jgi:hypothetical protein
MTLAVLLLVIAFVLFLIVAFGGFFPEIAGRLQNKINLTALGLALWVLALIMDRW